MSSVSPPRDLIANIERDARLPDGPGERFAGYGVMGLPFRSRHVLALRRWPASSVGPGYTSVWHRRPDGRWSFWSTVAPEISCTRYTGEVSEDTRVAAIELGWPEPYRLTIDSDEPSLVWDVEVVPTRRTRVLGALSRRLPGRMRSNEVVLRGMGPIAGWLLGVGRLALTGLMPNGQSYRAVPSYVWSVTASRALLDGVDLGVPAPIRPQATVGDFRIPQHGLLAIGSVDFDPLDERRHSTRVVRGG
jgi:hypothetical protein